MLSFRCSTAALVLAGASAFFTAVPVLAQTAPAPAPPPGPDTTAFPPIEPLPAPEPQLAPLPAPEPPKPSAPDRLSFGKNGGFFQPGATIQIFFLATHTDEQKTGTTFRVRRAEFTAKGEILPKLLSYRLMFDVAKTTPFTNANVAVNTGSAMTPSPGTVSVPQLGPDRSPLQDVYLTYLSDYADVTIGQFKIPVSLEALQSTARLLFPERSRVVSAFGDRRDIGIRIDKKIADVFYYYAGIFNGQGQNIVDADREKDLALRLEGYPIPGLTIGGVVYGTVGSSADDFARNRVEGDLRLDMADLFIQGEYIHAWTGPKSRRLEGQGAYGEAAYTIAGQFQPAFRFGFLDTNMNDLPTTVVSESGVQNQLEVGLNYLVKGYDAKFTAAYAYYSQENGPDTSELTLQALGWF